MNTSVESQPLNASKENSKSIKNNGELYDLVEKAQEGDMNAVESIIRHFRKEINSKSQLYFIAGADRDDVIQEAMIGLYKAIKNYDKSGGAKFETYANICMKRQLIDAIRSANREKHAPLNTSVSINKTVDLGHDSDYDETTLEETIESNDVTGVDVIKVINESLESLRNGPQALTKIETDVWHGYTQGKTYEEIADSLGKNVKSVYNAMARVKKKILLYISE